MAGEITPPPDGSGSGSSPPPAFRRLMKYVGTYPASGSDSRPLFVGNTCDPNGPRRLMKYVGEYPAFWTGGASGSGSLVASRPVFEFGECLTGLRTNTADNPADLVGPYIPPGYHPHGGTPWNCCGDEYDGYGVPMPDRLSAYLVRISTCNGSAEGCCINLDGIALNLHFRGFDPATGNIIYRSDLYWISVNHPLWVPAGPFTQVFSGYYQEVVSIQVQVLGWCVGEDLYWSISVTGGPASGVGAWTMLDRSSGPQHAAGAASTCAYPFPLYFGGGAPGNPDHPGPNYLQLFRFLGAGTYDPCNEAVGLSGDGYKVVVTAPPAGTVLLPGYPPNLDSGASGSGSGSRTSTAFRTPRVAGNRGLAKYVGGLAGRGVFVEACCSGSGSAAVTDTLFMFMSDDAGQCCLHGGTVALTGTAGSGGWAGTASCNGTTWTFFLSYDGFDWTLDISGSGGCGTQSGTMTANSTDPLDLTGTIRLGGGCDVTTGCANALMTFDITR